MNCLTDRGEFFKLKFEHYYKQKTITNSKRKPAIDGSTTPHESVSRFLF